MIIQGTPYGSKRIFIYRSEFPENVTQLNIAFLSLDALSIWGGCDKKTEEFMSWEFKNEISNEMLEMFCKRLNFKLTKGE